MSSRVEVDSGVPDFLSGGGELGELMRAHDWAATPLGAPSGWPRALKTAVRLILNTGHPMYIWWGPDLLCFYNDAYRRTLGPERHPGSLGQPGREVWAEIWHLIGHQVDFVMAGRGSTWDENRPVPITRYGRLDEIYWTYSYSPIDDETAPAGVGGVLVVCTETTEAVLTERRRAAERDRLSRMFEQAPGFMAMLAGPEHIFELTNSAYLQLTGHRDVTGKPVRQALPEVEGQGFFELLDKVYTSGEPFVGHAMSVELQRTPDAPMEQRFVDLVYQPITDVDGGVTGIFVEGSDVTEQVLAERELRKSKAQLAEQFDELEALYTEAPLGLALLDRDLRFVRINPALAEMNGFSVEDHLGRSAWDLVPGVRETAEPLLKRVIETGEPLRDVPVTGTTAAMPNVARYWTEHFYPLRDKAGTVQGIGIVCEEVTEKRHMEEALLEGEARLRALADNLPAGMIYQISTGADGSERRFLYVSQSHEKLTGVPAEDVLADPTIPYNLILPEYRERLVEAEAEAIRTKTPFDVEARFRRSDGEVRWCRILSAPREQTDGSIIWDGIQIDTTEQAEAEAALRELNDTLESRVAERTADLERAHEQLRQSQKMEALGALTGGVAHDFNNLLTPIVGSLDLLQRKGLGGDREGRLIDGALQSAERAKTLVQRLLAFARRQPLQPKPVDLGSLVTGMADLVASTTGPQIKVIVDLADGLPAAVVDPNQVEMAILNLSVNARDAMEGGGTLRISAQDEAVGDRNKQGLKPGRYVRLSVADTGTGMDDATLRKAAEPFFSTKGVGRGTGLGLSMVHGLAEQLGGTLVIESKLGIGTNVEMWLPASDQEAAQADRAQEGEARLTAGTALLVDDEDLVRSSTADMLGELGYDVIEARCAEEALKIVDERRFFDLLVTDHLMPGMTGTELAREVRARLPDIKILVISGYAEVDGVAPDLNRLTKPFRRSDLASMLGDSEEASSA